jgi:hypothetical protein
MRVFCYTDDKKVERVELEVDEIADKQIDPWRLDLYDPDPIRIERESAPALNFRRLRDVSFAYHRPNTPWYQYVVGFHDGSQTACLTGRLVEERAGVHVLTDVRPGSESFQECWREYLKEISWFLKSNERTRKLDLLGPGFPPSVAAAVQLSGNYLSFLSGNGQKRLQSFAFTGEMFAPRSVPKKLPPEVTWVFEEFRQHEPIVVGDPLRNLLRGKSLRLIEFFVAPNSLAAMERWMLENYGQLDRWAGNPHVSIKFNRHGCWYLVGVMDTPSIDQAFHSREFPSADRVYARRDGEIISSRISLFDIGKDSARQLTRFGWGSPGYPDRCARLKGDGFTVQSSDEDGPTDEKQG